MYILRFAAAVLSILVILCVLIFICQIKVSIGKTNEQNLSLLTATQWFCFVKFCANVDVGLFNEAFLDTTVEIELKTNISALRFEHEYLEF